MILHDWLVILMLLRTQSMICNLLDKKIEEDKQETLGQYCFEHERVRIRSGSTEHVNVKVMPSNRAIICSAHSSISVLMKVAGLD
uniref:Uncharacterized protein n=1 Tax=Salix viminalis TaxID=40686 RepID=A0A6N2K6U7_SALVM